MPRLQVWSNGFSSAAGVKYPDSRQKNMFETNSATAIMLFPKDRNCSGVIQTRANGTQHSVTRKRAGRILRARLS